MVWRMMKRGGGCAVGVLVPLIEAGRRHRKTQHHDLRRKSEACR
jgi:hypothetical protein